MSAPPVEPDNQTLAAAIIEISRTVDKIMKSGLNKKAIIVLVSASSGVGKRDCEFVLNHLAQLQRTYCT